LGFIRYGEFLDPSFSAEVKERVELCLFSPSLPSWQVQVELGVYGEFFDQAWNV